MSSTVFLTNSPELENVYSPTEHLHFIVVDLLVKQVAAVIFQGIFDSNNYKNH